MKTNFKAQANAFITANPNLKRKDYIAAFKEMGMTDHSASIYHYLYVTKVNKTAIKKIAPVVKGPQRDPKTGRFLKRTA